MGGGNKEKKLSSQVVGAQPIGAEPPYAPLRSYLGGGQDTPPPQSMPGQLELIAQQLHQGYPSMDQGALLKQLQDIYKPTPAPKKAPAAAATPAKTTGMSDAEYNYWHNYHGKGYGQGAMFEMPSDLLKFLSALGKR
jgi:hypothetical protein